jgi:cobyrinic acid a,c-diamide synthase
MAALEANAGLRQDIREKLIGGLPAYAECGGLMFLARSIAWRGESHEMIGVIPADVTVGSRPQGRGYMLLEESGEGPWPADSENSSPELPAHEFHYAALENLPGGETFAYRVKRGEGIDGKNDGLMIGNLLATFAHQRNTAANPWVGRFVEFVRSCRGG